MTKVRDFGPDVSCEKSESCLDEEKAAVKL
jgi:hypothetical protein